MKRLLVVLTVVLVAEVAVLLAFLPQTPDSLQPPVPNLDGYPLVTQQKVSDAVDDLKPESAHSWHRLADTFFACGCYPEAEVCYRQATVLKPDSDEFAYHYAFCLMSMGCLDDSIALFTDIQNRSPRLATRCQYFLGTIALRRNDEAEAVRNFARASEDLTAAALQLGILSLRSGALDAAERQLKQVEQRHPNSFRVHQLLAEIGERRVAVQSSSENSSLQRQVIDHREVADLVSEIVAGPWNERAIELTERADAIGVTGQAEKLIQRLRSGSVQSVQEELKTSLQHQWDPILADLMADALSALGKPDDQRKILQDIVRRDGWTASRALRLASSLKTGSDLEAAREALESGYQIRSTATGPEAAILCELLAEWNQQQGDSDSAGVYTAEALLLRGLNELQAVNLPLAAQFLESSLMSCPDQPDVKFQLHRIQRLTRQKNDGVE